MSASGDIDTNSSAIVMGSWDTSSLFYSGEMSNATIYDAALTSTQVSTYYFADIWRDNQTLGPQTQVCDYGNLDHGALVEDYGYLVANPQDGSPAAPDDQHPLTAWNP